ncbi:hypothetical protein HJC23_006012 [Cyclotella cryptica]|uniref:G-patch domain-containing protein n=1 Tax=Cyclotella cryptica TaxID=29204 RepID=A0ABD3P2F7_9STRA|eukprot:CCRYP_017883-RA/>CCRYP_017883-RA protein AED:0.00 eAED:0.00 QI:190/-1/1/1/-1/1/1/526/285
MAYTGLCGSKLRSKLGAVLNESATSHSPALLSSDVSFAKRQLEKMGWKEGTGLGKRRDGLVEHVKIRQREDEMGLGREKELARAVEDVWWKDSVGGTLAKLQAQKDKSSEKKKKKKSKKEKNDKPVVKIYTDEELFEATGGARFGMRAQRRAEAKWKRTESGNALAELEKKAEASMEWNGLGTAEVKLQQEHSTVEMKSHESKATRLAEDSREATEKRKRDEKSEPIECLDGREESESYKKKRTKKLRKKEEKARNRVHKISPPPSEEEVSQKKEKKEKRKKSKS